MPALRAWERLNGKVHDWNRYEVEVIPGHQGYDRT